MKNILTALAVLLATAITVALIWKGGDKPGFTRIPDDDLRKAMERVELLASESNLSPTNQPGLRESIDELRWQIGWCRLEHSGSSLKQDCEEATALADRASKTLKRGAEIDDLATNFASN